MALNFSTEIPDENGNMASAVAVAPKEYDVPNLDMVKEDVKEEIKTPDVQKNAISTAVSNNVKELMNIDLDSLDDRKQITSMINEMGTDLMFKSQEKSKLLNVRMGDLSKIGGENGAIASDLTKLSDEMKGLDPSAINFSNNKLLNKFVNPVKQYFSKYEKADDVIDDIIESLLKGKKQLQSDNTTLLIEQQALRDLTKKLNAQIEYCVEMDNQIEAQIDQLKATNGDPDKIKFLEEEILFALRQKTEDFEQMITVDQQGVIAMEILRRNNKELIRAVDRAQNVTVSALRVAVTVASGLYNQKIVLEKVQKLNATTNNMISSTARMLKDQGAEIHKESMNTSVNIETLREAFKNTFDALDDISNYKQAALPQMKAQILEFQLLAEEGEKRIQRLEKSDAFLSPEENK